LSEKEIKIINENETSNKNNININLIEQTSNITYINES
jgi:hypothetical protein